MDANMTFRMDSQVKAQMAELCAELGMTTSTAFNLFARAFVRSGGMPFPLQIRESRGAVPRAKMIEDADRLLDEFAEDYERLAK